MTARLTRSSVTTSTDFPGERSRRHRAGLNFGDCFTYALAATTLLPVLFLGDDFNHTDLTTAHH